MVAPDVIGNFHQTALLWNEVKGKKHIPWLPVWQWGDSRKNLEILLAEYDVVGIGGLVPLMQKLQRGQLKGLEMLDELTSLCKAYPWRLHLFGACSLDALNAIRDTAYSVDTSKWIDGARYGRIIHQHRQREVLVSIPWKWLLPYYPDLDLSQAGNRCIASANELAKVSGEAFSPVTPAITPP